MGSKEGWGISWYVFLFFRFFSFSILIMYWGYAFSMHSMHSLYTTWMTCLVILFNTWSNHFLLHLEVKALKSLVRNVIAPNRDLGHTDRALKKEQGEQTAAKKEEEKEGSKDKAACEDCQ